MIAESLQNGVSVITNVVKTLPNQPGVYRMIGAHDVILYIGKAKNLKKRVINYTQHENLPLRLKRMVSETLRMEIVVTHTEVEALLLESNLIKKWRPKYNILLKDDKAFPYLLLTKHTFPQLIKYRGKPNNEEGTFFGPFASSQAVDSTLISLQKVFQLRSCSDEIFKNRKRPCLQYYIKRCSAPCCSLISQKDYEKTTKLTTSFLNGKTNDVQSFLSTQMQEASTNYHYEEAARIRDRLMLLTTIQTNQLINDPTIKDAHFHSIARVNNTYCIQIFFFQNGQNYGTESFFLDHPSDSLEENISAFLKQFYEYRPPASQVFFNVEPSDLTLIKDALFEKYAIKTLWNKPKLGKKKDILNLGEINATAALNRELTHKTTLKKVFEEIKEVFFLDDLPKRIEIYDNSHLFGTNAYGVMVVATQEGFEKKSYKKFLIKKEQPSGGGDDFAMMKEVMERRFAHVDNDTWVRPDLVLVDGGVGQVNAVLDVFNEKGINDIPIVGIAKGPHRNAGEETFILPGKESFQLPKTSKTLHVIQQMRDEAHRFGITSHRLKRLKNLKKSSLDDISGVGIKRKKALLKHFGSANHVAQAALDDLLLVDGIDKSIAKKIYQYFHDR